MNDTRTSRPALAVLVIAFVAFVMLGMVDSALGVAWPSIAGFYERGLPDLGFLLVAGGTGYLIASFFYGRLHDRFGTATLLIAGTAIVVLGLVGLAAAQAWPLVVISPLFLGLGGGLVDTGMNAYAALAFDMRSMNLLHACFGVGATLGPLVVTLSLTTTGVWRSGYWFLALAQIATGVAIWLRRRVWVAGESDQVPAAVSPRRRRSAFLIVLFLLYTGVEFGVGQWAFTLLSEGRGLATAAAGAWVSAYWAGLMAGRFTVGLVGHRWTPATILNGSLLIALCGLAILWANPGGAGAVGLPITGFGLAPVFPTLVSLTPQRIGRDRSTSSIGYQLAAATIGGSVIPWGIGLIAGVAGLEALATSLLVVALLLTLVMVVSEREARIV